MYTLFHNRPLIISATFAIISLTAFNYHNSATHHSQLVNNETVEKSIDKPKLLFFYAYGTRFKGISKAMVHQATDITDFFTEEDIQRTVSYGKVRLMIIKNERQSDERVYSEGTSLTAAQRKLLSSLDYNGSFNLRADCTYKNLETGELDKSFNSPHLTIVPEKQAEYVNGKEALLNYLKKGSKKEKEIAHQLERLRPARLVFTVTKNGEITNVKVGNRSDCDVMDKKMVKLISNMPGKWNPAENDKREKIDQVLVISYGLMGC